MNFFLINNSGGEYNYYRPESKYQWLNKYKSTGAEVVLTVCGCRDKLSNKHLQQFSHSDLSPLHFFMVKGLKGGQFETKKACSLFDLTFSHHQTHQIKQAKVLNYRTALYFLLLPLDKRSLTTTDNFYILWDTFASKSILLQTVKFIYIQRK